GEALDGLARLNAAAVLLAVCGGLGAVVAYAGFPWVRAYNRISVFIGFFALAAVALLLQRLGDRMGQGRAGRWGFPAALLVMALAGVLDQSPAHLRQVHQQSARTYLADRAFARQIEEVGGKDAKLFQLPYMWFPESPPVEQLIDYSLLQPYAHAPGLSLSA